MIKRINMCLKSGVWLMLLLISMGASADIEEEVKLKIKKFIGHDQNVNFFNSISGMVGVGLTTKTGKKRVFYATPDGEYLIAGALVETSSGNNVSMDEIAKYAPKPDFSDLVKTIKESSYIETGALDAENELYVFIDPNCGYCHKAYELIEKNSELQGAYKVRWIPVAVLGPSSTNKSQGLLGADVKRQESSLDAVMTKLPYQPKMEFIEKGSQLLKKNMRIFSGNGFSGVPVVIKSTKSNDIEVIEGLPSEAWFKSNE